MAAVADEQSRGEVRPHSLRLVDRLADLLVLEPGVPQRGSALSATCCQRLGETPCALASR